MSDLPKLYIEGYRHAIYHIHSDMQQSIRSVTRRLMAPVVEGEKGALSAEKRLELEYELNNLIKFLDYLTFARERFKD